MMREGVGGTARLAELAAAVAASSAAPPCAALAQLEAVCDSRNSFAQQKEHETDLEIFRNGKCGYYGSSGRRGCRLCAFGADG